MSRVIAYMNQKGGVAKTTSAVTMAYCLEERGYSVLFLDLDAQANSSVLLLTSKRYEEVLQHNIVTLANNESTFEETVQRVSSNIDVIPSTLLLTTAEIDWQQRISREFIIKRILDPVRDRYDFIIIDTPPHLMLLALNVIVATDDIIIPYNADSFSLEGIKMVYDAIQPVKKGGLNNVGISGLLLTRFEQNRMNNFIAENIEPLATNLGVKHLYKTTIRKTTKIPESITAETSLLSYASDSTAAADYRSFTAEYLELNGFPMKKGE